MTLSRRIFVKGSLISAAALTARCGNDVNAAPIVDATVDDDKTSSTYGMVAVAVPMYPDLAKVGGAVTLRLSALPPDATRPFTVPPHGVLLIHRAAVGNDPEFVATRSDCPHQGCPLGYSATDQLIECPCHASKFRAVTDPMDKTQCAGLVTHLPAKANLAVYKATVIGDYAYVDLRTDLGCDAQSGIPGVVDGKVTIPISAFPALGTVGGNLIGQPTGLADRLIVARVSDTEVICLSSICTHRRCDIGLNITDKRMDCPCHGGQYNYDGSIISGPQPAPVKKYDVSFANDVIVITVA